MRVLPYDLLKIPPNLKINCPENEAAAELADGVLSGAIFEHLRFCKSKTSQSLVTSPLGPENPPMMYIF